MTTDHGQVIQGLGEVVLRTRRMGEMVVFYRDILGLKPLLETGEVVFFEIAPGYAGHTQVVALFDESIPPDHPEARHGEVDVSRSPVHHFAFAIGLQDYRREEARLGGLGLTVRTATHPWVSWRSLYVRDPDGNVVELVCYDESLSTKEVK